MTHVLIVDDRLDNLYLLRALLQGNGYTVTQAHNGAEALDRAREVLPQLVISDLLMPMMDGYTLLRHWKADERLRSIPFVVYTATYTDPKDERLALDLGAAAFILKPAEPEPFIARIREVLAKSAGEASELVGAPPLEENVLLKEYSEVLVRKLEKKALQLEQTNRTLLEDIAQRKRAEERVWLQASLLDQVRNAVLAVDRRGLVIYWNKFAETLYRWTQAEAMGRNIVDLIVPSSEFQRAAEIFATVEEAGHWEGDWMQRRKDGATFPALVLNKSLLDVQGRRVGMVSVAIDITERRRLEEQYRQAQKMEVVGKLAGGVAHDFNNLLTVITGYGELALASMRPGDPVREMIVQVLESSERATSLTRQLLAFSRQEFLAPKVLDINAIVQECEKILRRLIGEDVRFSTERDPALFQVRADPGHMEQILLNLVVNARDAMPRGGSLVIRTRNAESEGAADGEYAVLEVTDTGVGMDPAIQARIFEPFFTTKGKRGTGLGLATVHDIVQKSGGRIEVVSAVGKGTTFAIYLPRVEGTTAAKTVRPSNPTPSPSGTETVLLTEDEEGVRMLTRSILRSLGYTVLDTNRGSEALAISKRHIGTIHLLITDVVMPEMSGRELAERLIAIRPEMKVLFLSGYTDDALLDHGVSQAEVAFLQKPYTPTSLAFKIREALDATITSQ